MEKEQRSLAQVFQPRNFQEATELAERLAKSDMVPRDYKNRPGDILIAMAYGAEVGLPWTQALTSIWIADGKPTMYGDSGLALVERSGLLESIKEWDEEVEEGTAFCQVQRKGKPEPVVRSFSMVRAKQIILSYRDKEGQKKYYPLVSKDTWKNYPWRMRQFRARWLALRDVFPDVLKGIVSREEAEDVTPPGTERADLLPAPEEIPEPRRASEGRVIEEGAEIKAATEMGGEAETPQPALESVRCACGTEQMIDPILPQSDWPKCCEAPDWSRKEETPPEPKPAERKKKATKLRDKKTAPPEDPAKEFLTWLENASEEEIASDKNFITKGLGKLKGKGDAMQRVLTAWNTKKRELFK